MRLKIKLSITVCLALCSIQQPVEGRDLVPLTATELQSACRRHLIDAVSEEARICPAYVRGYIEASPVVVLRSQGSDESFTQRAFRTRNGVIVSRPQFCLRQSLTVDELANQIVLQADSHPPKSEQMAGELIEATLTRFHRCSANRRNSDQAKSD